MLLSKCIQYVIFLIGLSILHQNCFVETAPISNIASTKRTIAQNISEIRELQFQNFFKNLPEESFEQTEHDMEEIYQIEQKIFDDFPFLLDNKQESLMARTDDSSNPSAENKTREITETNNNKSTENKTKEIINNPRKNTGNDFVSIKTENETREPEHNSRKRRSAPQRYETQARSRYRLRLLRYYQELYCKRRCAWRRLWFLATHGVEPSACSC
uniref:Cnidarian restricted protein n=1 Tax=Clytia hemisphaerica TaxID=252671 RepID=A0A7M5ULD5_9CNID|eukprot:TCONS_00051059-protein